MLSLIDAAKSGNHAAVQQVLATGRYDINCQDSERKGTPLFWAATGGHREIVQLLLERGANMEIPVKWDMTPLMAAVDRKHYRIAELLLGRGANVNAQSQKGDTALHLAAYRGSRHLCSLLINYGACTNILNNNGKTAQQEAAGAGHAVITNLLSPQSPDTYTNTGPRSKSPDTYTNTGPRIAVCRSSSLPLTHTDEPPRPISPDWIDPRIPSESDESALAVSRNRKSLRRQLLQSGVPSTPSTGPRNAGELFRSHSANQLHVMGRVSPPIIHRHGSPPDRYTEKRRSHPAVGFEFPVQHIADAPYQLGPVTKPKRDYPSEPHRLTTGAGVFSNNRNQKHVRTQSGPALRDSSDVHSGIERLLSMVEKLEAEKSALLKENKALEQKLQILQSLVDSAFATDTSSEESWQTPHHKHGLQDRESLDRGLAEQLESEQRRRADLDKLCAKLVAENERLKACVMAAPPSGDATQNGHALRTEGSGLGNNRPLQRHLHDMQQMASEPSKTDRFFHEAVPGHYPSEAPLSSSSSESSSLDYPSVESMSSQKQSHSHESLGDPARGQQSPQLQERRSFLRECWRSLNSSYLRLPSQARMVVSTAAKLGNPHSAPGKGLQDITRQMLQTIGDGEGSGGCTSLYRQSTDSAMFDLNCHVNIQEKLGQMMASDGTMLATFRGVVNNRSYILKVHTAREEQEISAVKSLLPHPHLYQPLGSLTLSPSRGDGLRRQILAQLHVDPAGALLQGVLLKCSMFPDYKVSLSELFRYGLHPDRESPAPCSEAGLLRILLQLLRALEPLLQEGRNHGDLQQEGRSHGEVLQEGRNYADVQPHQVFVMEDLRITLGGLDSSQACAEEKRRAWASEDHPVISASQDAVPDLLFKPATDNILHTSQRQATTPHQQKSSETYQIAAMLCSLLSATNKFGQRSGEEATEDHICSPPDWLSQNFYCLLLEMLNDDAEKRPPVKAAILRVAMMLYGPRVGEIRSETDCNDWLTAQAFRLLMNAPQDQSKSSQQAQSPSCESLMTSLDWFMCREFILSVTPTHLWQLYQTCQAAWTNSTRS